jgi:hypothetical protein
LGKKVAEANFPPAQLAVVVEELLLSTQLLHLHF